MEGYSIQAQTERLQAYCKAKSWGIVCDTVKVPTVIVQNSPSHRGNFPIKSGTP